MSPRVIKQPECDANALTTVLVYWLLAHQIFPAKRIVNSRDCLQLRCIAKSEFHPELRGNQSDSQSDSFDLRTPLCKTATFQASYSNRIVKLWNYVCKLVPRTSFYSPNPFQLLSAN